MILYNSLFQLEIAQKRMNETYISAIAQRQRSELTINRNFFKHLGTAIEDMRDEKRFIIDSFYKKANNPLFQSRMESGELIEEQQRRLREPFLGLKIFKKYPLDTEYNEQIRHMYYITGEYTDNKTGSRDIQKFIDEIHRVDYQRARFIDMQIEELY